MEKLTRHYTITLEVEGTYTDQVEDPPAQVAFIPARRSA